MEIGQAPVPVTTAAQDRRKGADRRAGLPSLGLVLVIGDNVPEGCVSLAPAIAAASDTSETERTGPEDMAPLHVASGTTGPPKGWVHVREAVVAHTEAGASSSTSIRARPAGARPIPAGSRA